MMASTGTPLDVDGFAGPGRVGEVTMPREMASLSCAPSDGCTKDEDCMRKTTGALAGLLALSMLVAACGGDDADTSGSSGTTAAGGTGGTAAGSSETTAV